MKSSFKNGETVDMHELFLKTPPSYKYVKDLHLNNAPATLCTYAAVIHNMNLPEHTSFVAISDCT
jgi:hypothetical protein